MKRILFSVFALLALCKVASAQTISIPEDLYVSQGQIMAFPVSLTIDESKVDVYSAMTLNAEFPETGFSTTGGYTVSSDWPAASPTIPPIAADGKATIPFSSANEIKAAKANYLLSISIKAANDLAPGDYTVKIGAVLENAAGTIVDPTSDVTFKIHVQDKTEAEKTLDENSPLVPEEADDVKIRVFRTIEAGKWSTICLPFRMTADQWKTAFGDDVEVRRLTAYDKSGDNITLTFGTPLTGNMVAKYPYIIKTSKNIKSFDATSSISVSSPKETIWDNPDEENEKYAEFTGINKAGVVVPENNLFINNNEFWVSKGKTITKAFRGYFWVKDAVSSAPVLMAFDNETTGVSTVKSEKDNDTVYNLNGQRITNPQKGMFIINGKKFVIK